MNNHKTVRVAAIQLSTENGQQEKNHFEQCFIFPSYRGSTLFLVS